MEEVPPIENGQQGEEDEGMFSGAMGVVASNTDNSKTIINVRESLTEEQLAKLDKFKASVFAVPPAGSPFYDFNEKQKKKKRGPTEPPTPRLWVEELTDKQKEWLDERCLCRYLRAREWDLEKAEHMIRCTLAWRVDYKPEEITAAEIEDQSKTGKMYFCYEYSKRGYPVVYMKLTRDQGNDRVTKLKFMVWMLEHIISAMDTSQGVEKMAWITDFKGTGMRMATMSHINISLDCLHTLQNHYPERLGVAFVVNPPRVFSAFWKILTPWMNETTLNKIKFVGGHKDYPLIMEHVDKAILEKTYGGELDRDYDHAAFVAREINGEGKPQKGN
jgi:hypothetical protein